MTRELFIIIIIIIVIIIIIICFYVFSALCSVCSGFLRCFHGSNRVFVANQGSFSGGQNSPIAYSLFSGSSLLKMPKGVHWSTGF